MNCHSLTKTLSVHFARGFINSIYLSPSKTVLFTVFCFATILCYNISLVKHLPRKERKEVVSARPRFKSFRSVRGDEVWQWSKDSADAATAVSFMIYKRNSASLERK